MLIEKEIATTATKTNLRKHERLDYAAACLIQTEKRALHGYAKNISEGGMSFRLQGLGKLKRGDTMALHVHTFPPITAIVRWVSERTIGVQFTEAITSNPELAGAIKRLQEPTPIIAEPAGQKPDATPALPMEEIIAWVRGLED